MGQSASFSTDVFTPDNLRKTYGGEGRACEVVDIVDLVFGDDTVGFGHFCRERDQSDREGDAVLRIGRAIAAGEAAQEADDRAGLG